MSSPVSLFFMSKWQLMMAFLNRTPITIRGIEFIVINSVEHEDGSGRSFNITGYPSDAGNITGIPLQRTVHLKTID